VGVEGQWECKGITCQEESISLKFLPLFAFTFLILVITGIYLFLCAQLLQVRAAAFHLATIVDTTTSVVPMSAQG